MYETFIAFRYLRAKRAQGFISFITGISILGIALGVASLILVLAVMTGFHDGLRNKILGSTPHATVENRLGNIEDVGSVRDIIEATPAVESATAYVLSEAMLISKGNVAGVNLKGVEPTHKVLLQKITAIRADQLLQPLGDGTNPILLGRVVARKLGLSPGDKVSVIPPKFTLTPFGMIPKMRDFLVIGVIENEDSFIDSYSAYIDVSVAQNLFEVKDTVDAFEVEFSSFDDVNAGVKSLRGNLEAPLVAVSWEDSFGSVLVALKLEKLGLFIVLTIIILVAAFNIATTLIMVVMDKTRDIAILKTMGATNLSISAIFMLQGLLVGVFGTVLGCVLGLLLAQNADSTIKLIEGTFDISLFDKAVYGLDHFPSEVNMPDVVLVACVSLAISVFATIYPAMRAARLDPAETLRYE